MLHPHTTLQYVNDGVSYGIFATTFIPQPPSEWSLGGLDLLDANNWELRMTCSDEY